MVIADLLRHETALHRYAASLRGRPGAFRTHVSYVLSNRLRTRYTLAKTNSMCIYARFVASRQ